jgi:hypothetical protein
VYFVQVGIDNLSSVFVRFSLPYTKRQNTETLPSSHVILSEFPVIDLMHHGKTILSFLSYGICNVRNNLYIPTLILPLICFKTAFLQKIDVITFLYT